MKTREQLVKVLTFVKELHSHSIYNLDGIKKRFEDETGEKSLKWRSVSYVYSKQRAVDATDLAELLAKQYVPDYTDSKYIGAGFTHQYAIKMLEKAIEDTLDPVFDEIA